MAKAKPDEEQQFLKKFLFPLEPVMEVSGDKAPAIKKRIQYGLPLLIRKSGQADSLLRWSPDFLRKNLLGDKNAVFISKNETFKYWSDAEKQKVAGFVPPTRRADMTMAAFCDRLAAWKPGHERLYMQSMMMDGFGPDLLTSFKAVKRKWFDAMQRTGSWGEAIGNQLLIGQKGNTLTVNYEVYENLLVQVHGSKRLLLFAPEMFPCLYPYPIHHPHDRQAQVDLENLDFIRFPNCAGLSGYSVQMNPGDILYVPSFWWHHVETASKVAVAVTFLYKMKSFHNTKIRFPLGFREKMSMMRCYENMVGQMMGDDPDEVAAFFVDMVSGRYGTSSIGSLKSLPFQRALSMDDDDEEEDDEDYDPAAASYEFVLDSDEMPEENRRSRKIPPKAS